ncbi:MAG: enoyl-CoA hydratase-related protein [Dehalococcoidia bacterium]|nr:enoyl-CoA hydratase-related protein [Dehalococcoidia bacterium]
MYQHITLEKEKGVATVLLNKADRFNLLDFEVLDELTSAMARLNDDDEVGVVVLGTAKKEVFSGGADVDFMLSLTPARARKFVRTVHKACDSIRHLEKPVIAALSGHCLGGGCEMAMACDIRIAAENTRIGLPEIKAGIPSVVEAALMPRLIGMGKVREMVLTGDSIDAAEAERIGLVNKVVPLAGLGQAARDMAGRILANGPFAVRMQKDILNKWMETDLAAAMEHSINCFALCFTTDEPRESMTAFKEKRKPRFKGDGR